MMPLLSVHMSIVQEVIEKLPLDNNLGPALLGSTAPDRRVMTGQERSETHYFELKKDTIGDGLRNMKNIYPSIFSLAKKNGPSSQAFLIGYVSHLVADETWIVDVYRKYFEKDEYFGTNPLKNVIDRAFQYSIERDIRSDKDVVAYWRRNITDAQLTLVDKEFMPIEAMEDWKRFILERITTWAADWNEFPRLIQRFIDEIDIDEATLKKNLDDPQLMLDQIEKTLPSSLLENYRNDVVEHTLEIAEEILK